MCKNRKSFYVAVTGDREHLRNVRLYYGKVRRDKSGGMQITSCVDFGGGISDTRDNRWFAGLSINEKGVYVGKVDITYTPLLEFPRMGKKDALNKFIDHEFTVNFTRPLTRGI